MEIALGFDDGAVERSDRHGFLGLKGGSKGFHAWSCSVQDSILEVTALGGIDSSGLGLGF